MVFLSCEPFEFFWKVPTPHFSSTQRFSGGAYPLLFINLQDFRGVPTPYISSTKRFSEGAHPLLFINPKGTWTRTWEFWIWINPKGCPPLTFINLKVFRGVPSSHFDQPKGFNFFSTSPHPLNIKKSLPGGGGGRWWEGEAGKNFFLEFDTFFIFNLKILPIWFSQVSRCHLKAFFPRILKQGLLFDICDFSVFKI